MSADLGQGEELEPLREKAVRTGASKIYIEDLKEEFITDFIYPPFRPERSTKGNIFGNLLLPAR
jgi:argininosuccinate synthase